MKRVKEVDRSRITDTTPVRLALAAELAFPDGSVTYETLRQEVAAGRLTGWKIGNKPLTSQAEINLWLKRCRVNNAPRGVTGVADPSDLPSDEEHTSVALQALLAQVERVTGPSRRKAKTSTRHRP